MDIGDYYWGLYRGYYRDIGDYYWGLCRGYYRDPFPHSLLRTRQINAPALKRQQVSRTPKP